MSKKKLENFFFFLITSGPYVMASVATKIFQELVEGVFYIHSMGVVHRDLKVSGKDEIIENYLSGLTCVDSLNEGD